MKRLKRAAPLTRALLLSVSIVVFDAGAALAQTSPQRRPSVQSQLDEAMALIRAQQARIDQQSAELNALRERLDRAPVATASASAPLPAPATNQASISQPLETTAVVPLERVGEAPEDSAQPIALAVLDMQTSVVTRRGALTGELQFDYTRSDRNRAVFRGIELVEAVLVGVFDINESRQDVLSASAQLRYGVTDRFELGVRLPYVYRSDKSIIAPIAGSTPNDPAATIDNSTNGNGIGDLEVIARYQLLDGGRDRPYVIANLQAVFPTGTDSFEVPRDNLGRATKAATGAGFYGITPSATFILPSDPVVLFGTLGYTFNLAKNVDTQIPPVIIDRVNPGDAISASAGIGVSFNERTTLNLGYAHSWAFGSRTRTRLIEPTPQNMGTTISTSRDLQIGRFLFGVTYRVNDRSSINWAVEVGATEDASDVRTVLRLPLTLVTGR